MCVCVCVCVRVCISSPLLSQTVIDPFKECEIVIFKKSQVLGVIITGGADSVLEGVYIQKILPDSPASKDGRLKPGDQILTVNDVSMSRLTRDEALQALQRSSSTVRLRVMRDPNRTATVLHGEGWCHTLTLMLFEIIMCMLQYWKCAHCNI